MHTFFENLSFIRIQHPIIFDSDMSFETLTLVPANKEQTRETRRQTYAEWAKGLTLDEYLARETILDAAEHAAVKLTTWLVPKPNRPVLGFADKCSYRVLVPRNDTATSNFLCLCETCVLILPKKVDISKVFSVTAAEVSLRGPLLLSLRKSSPTEFHLSSPRFNIAGDAMAAS